MKVGKSLGLFILFALSTGAAWSAWGNWVVFSRILGFSEVVNPALGVQDRNDNNPCWFRTPGALQSASLEMVRKREERNLLQTFGYPADTPLSEAVKIFNEEMECSPLERDYPRLTEDEVIAAVVVGVNNNNRGTTFHTERDVFWKIVTEKVVPKGTVLGSHSGGNVQGSPLAPRGTISANGIEIFLRLGADKNGRSEFPPAPKLEQVLTIRKTFYNIEIR